MDDRQPLPKQSSETEQQYRERVIKEQEQAAHKEPVRHKTHAHK